MKKTTTEMNEVKTAKESLIFYWNADEQRIPNIIENNSTFLHKVDAFIAITETLIAENDKNADGLLHIVKSIQEHFTNMNPKNFN